jgi:Uma2 family endonuclease
MTQEEFEAGDYEEGYKYEIIDGSLYVSPLPNLPEARIDNWLYIKVAVYSEKHAEIVNFVINKARVFVPGRPGLTVPEPDLAAYHNFPLDRPIRRLRWQDVSPLLVGEVLSPEDPGKDLVRNVMLYLQVPTIQEYWILDGREDPDQPTLIVHRRRGRKWQRVIQVNYGETYTTKLLPGFELLVDPRR